jgi:uncharacterized protein YabN with tetrapyrrole methylase and pyrophosphatase domain
MMAALPEASLNAFAFDRLLQVVDRLRGENGCPWDIKQTPASLKKYLMEECAELAEAIESGHIEGVREELGDLLFVLALLITMYREQQLFTADDVLEDIIAKMIRRHPHVFAGVSLCDEQGLRDQWERIKQQEKSITSSRP